MLAFSRYFSVKWCRLQLALFVWSEKGVSALMEVFREREFRERERGDLGMKEGRKRERGGGDDFGLGEKLKKMSSINGVLPPSIVYWDLVILLGIFLLGVCFCYWGLLGVWFGSANGCPSLRGSGAWGFSMADTWDFFCIKAWVYCTFVGMGVALMCK